MHGSPRRSFRIGLSGAVLAGLVLGQVPTVHAASGSVRRTIGPAVTVPIAVDVAGAAGLAETVQTGQSFADDLNGDGLPDIFLNRSGSNTAQEFLNAGNGTFSEVNAGAFPDADRRDCSPADVDGDGRMDVFCSLGAHHSRWLKSDELWLQQPDGTFVDGGQAAGVAGPMSRSRSTTFLDANGDGWPDLFVGADPDRPDGLPSADQLFINRGDGTFDDAPSFGLDSDVGSGCLQAVDFDGDGRQDLLTCGFNDRPMRLLRNVGGTHFDDVTAAVGLAGLDPMDVLLTDVNADGAPDLVVLLQTQVEVMLQSGGTFQPPAATFPLTSGVAMAAGDANGDGLPDLYVVQSGSTPQGNEPDLMLLNAWDGSQLTLQQMTIPETTQGIGDDVYAIDHDGNGLTDFLVLNGGQRPGPTQLIAFFPASATMGPQARGMRDGRMMSSAREVATAGPVGGPVAGISGRSTPSGQVASSRCTAAWSTVGSPPPPLGDSELRGMAATGHGTAWAVGNQGNNKPLVESWDGSSFTLATTPDLGAGDSGLNSVTAASSNDVWTVGYHLNGLTYSGVAERWDGTAWTVASLPNAGSGTNLLFGVSAGAGDAVWAVGADAVTAGYQPLVERWNGSAWSIVSTPNAPGSGSNVLEGVVALSAQNAWAVGYARDLASGANRTLTMRTIDGSTWQVVPSEDPSTDGDVLLRVGAVSADDVWAVGFQASGSTYAPLAEHWDGTRWTASAPPAPPGSGFAILRGVQALAGGDVWAVGAWYDPATAQYEPLQEHYDGVSWSIVPGPIVEGDSQLIGAASVTGHDVWALGRNQSRPVLPVVRRICPIQVTDAGSSPRSATSAQGSAVAWSIPATDAASHSVTDGSGMGLFDSGLRAPGGSFVVVLDAAGSYPIVDTATGGTSTVKIPIRSSPAAGGVGTTFTVTWSAAPPPAGSAFDVSIKRPGGSWSPWITHVTSVASAFVPDAGTGTYLFRARITNLGNGTASGYSPPASIVVS